ncbi:hypothetical protein SFUMM280S_11212 [Streptomyces fumanus]
MAKSYFSLRSSVTVMLLTPTSYLPLSRPTKMFSQETGVMRTLRPRTSPIRWAMSVSTPMTVLLSVA